MERNQDMIKCVYCKFYFVPEPTVKRQGKKMISYIECPRCGNGIERVGRWHGGGMVNRQPRRSVTATVGEKHE